jgi:hypothetical protein
MQRIRGIPNIEPLTRGLSLLLMNKPYFKEKYNIYNRNDQLTSVT